MDDEKITLDEKKIDNEELENKFDRFVECLKDVRKAFSNVHGVHASLDEIERSLLYTAPEALLGNHKVSYVHLFSLMYPGVDDNIERYLDRGSEKHRIWVKCHKEYEDLRAYVGVSPTRTLK